MINQEEILNNVDIGIVLCDENGKTKFTNDYAKQLFFENNFDIFYIFPELNDIEFLNSDFKVLTKTYNFNLFFLFPKIKDDKRIGFLVIIKDEKFFSSILNQEEKFNKIEKYDFKNIIGNSSQITKVIEESKKIANTGSNILITGESGTGKEFFARAIHNSSSRKNNPFIPVNCGAIPKDLIESELFGYEGGSFTGANKNGYIGKFELANGGTIFLDEIGEMPLNMQVSLLRVLQDKCITRIGSKKCTSVLWLSELLLRSTVPFDF